MQISKDAQCLICYIKAPIAGKPLGYKHLANLGAIECLD